MKSGRVLALPRAGFRLALAATVLYFAPALAPHSTLKLGISANAQESASCRRLADQIRALSRAKPRGTDRYQRAAARQQRELNRTAVYAERLGCNRSRFLFFGSAPPPQCEGINKKIKGMRANLSNLQTKFTSADVGRRALLNKLLSRYNYNCRQQAAVKMPERNFFERLFDDQPRREETYDDLLKDLLVNDLPRGGSQAICVRTCDGGFFPVSYSARQRQTGYLAELCTALCPNTEAKLFTYRAGRGIDEAVSTDGEPYKDLANAGKYRTNYTPGCTCKPPNQSWVQALQKAEELLNNKSKRDLIVTVEKSKELSKAKKVKESKRRRSKREIEDEKEAERERLELEQAGKRAALEVQNNQAGIAPGRESRRSVYSLHDGEKKEVRTANGETRTVRIIAPKL